ncbi:MAG: hypothetical protein HOZ81_31265 [Streptomyces sp.]|nr:hypothetical protein [Streptomyces sp.]
MRTRHSRPAPRRRVGGAHAPVAGRRRTSDQAACPGSDGLADRTDRHRVEVDARGLVEREADRLGHRFRAHRDGWCLAVPERGVERKRIVHPTVGLLDLNCLSLFSEDGRQRLLWFTPRAGTDTAEKLALLTVVGTQAMETDRVR